MTTYQQTQTDDPVWGTVFQRPDKYTLYLACAPDATLGYVEVRPDSDNPTKFSVIDIPADVPPIHVARHLASIAIATHPDQLMWSAVASLPAGRLVKSRRDGNVVYVADAKHWSGQTCIGWMHDCTRETR